MFRELRQVLRAVFHKLSYLVIVRPPSSIGYGPHAAASTSGQYFRIQDCSTKRGTPLRPTDLVRPCGSCQ